MANTVYANKIIEAKAKDLLTTAVNARSLMNVDNDLTGTPGMTKTINTYTYTGEVEELGVGVVVVLKKLPATSLLMKWL